MEAVTAPARLLVVDDEATILELLSGSLRLAGFEVVTAASGAGAVRAAASSRPDLVLLDVMMPDGDGFEALRRIRSGGCEVPVIFLTARDEVPDRVKGFAMGADDYVTKPFSLEELLGRIRAVLKRTRLGGPRSRLRVAGLELDEDTHEVRRDGAAVALTPTEFRLLRFLMVNAGRVVSKGEILDHTAALGLASAGIGTCVVPVTSSVLGAVPAARSGMAASATNTSREFGAVTGIAILGAVVNAELRSGLVSRMTHLGATPALQQYVLQVIETGSVSLGHGSPTGNSPLDQIIRAGYAAFTSALHDALYLSAALLVGAALLSAVTLRQRHHAT